MMYVQSDASGIQNKQRICPVPTRPPDAYGVVSRWNCEKEKIANRYLQQMRSTIPSNVKGQANLFYQLFSSSSSLPQEPSQLVID